jgi:serine/threonine protein kinase
MTPEQWQQVERLYHLALERPAEDRGAFLSETCGHDRELRREVESLLAHSDSRTIGFEQGALAKAAQLISTTDVAPMIGRRFGVYELEELIGAGGMGEVYRARDTRLSRDVAIKILPAAFKTDAACIARFEREAQVLASLKHPHIGAVHGLEEADGFSALVMELVDGEDLSDRLARGPLPGSEALTIARQIAEALEAAHEQGIIHRDLKPANIRIRRDGNVKVLDFGLAKSIAPLKGAPVLTTMSAPAGAAMGTPAYMSPEQARGEAASRESDVWAFGVVLYEMLTGTSPFARPTTAETLSRVLTTAPDESLLPPDTPAGVRRLIRRCLDKDPRRRWHHLGDARVEIDEALSSSDSSVAESAAREDPRVHAAMRSAQTWRWLAMALFAIGAVGGAVAWTAGRAAPSTPGPVVRFDLASDSGLGVLSRAGLAISPDGTRLAYLAAQGITLRARDRLETRVLQNLGTFPSGPAFSPDGEWLAYTDGALLKKVAVAGGAPVDVADIGPGATLDWAPEGIVFADVSGLFRVRDGAAPERLAIEVAAHEQISFPEILPGGRAILYTVVPTRSIIIGGSLNVAGARIEVFDLASATQKTLVHGASHPSFLPTGHLVYLAGGTLRAVAFDAATAELRSKPVEMLGESAAGFALSSEGTLVYSRGGEQINRTLVWVDRQGREEPLGTPPRTYIYPRLSPDGARIALDVSDSADRDIWMWNVGRKTLERFTVDPAGNPLMAWSRDGKHLVFGSDRFGPSNLFMQAANGSGVAERLLVSDHIQMPIVVAPDNRLLFSAELPGQGRNIQALSMDGSRRVESLLDGPANELLADVSPDGRWLAHDSNESGQFEIYVRPYPNVDEGRWKVSLQGGRQPLWSRDGTELFYRDFTGAVMATSVTTTPTFTPGAVTQVLAGAGYHGDGPFGSARTYDLSIDGSRFLMIKNEPQTVRPSLVVVINWHEELKQRLPEQP